MEFGACQAGWTLEETRWSPVQPQPWPDDPPIACVVARSWRQCGAEYHTPTTACKLRDTMTCRPGCRTTERRSGLVSSLFRYARATLHEKNSVQSLRVISNAPILSRQVRRIRESMRRPAMAKRPPPYPGCSSSQSRSPGCRSSPARSKVLEIDEWIQSNK